MDRYYKLIKDGYIITVGIGVSSEEITQDEYNAIRYLIKNRPTAETGYMYKLKTDLTWEKVEAPAPQPAPDREISDRAALDIILGGAKV